MQAGLPLYIDQSRDSTSTSTEASSECSSPYSQASSTKRSRKKIKPEKPTANHHLPPRSSCDACRRRKLKCDGQQMDQGECTRCIRDQVMCHYSTRAPIGRPKGSVAPVKRRRCTATDSSQATPVTRSPFEETLSFPSSLQTSSTAYNLSSTSMQPFAALQYAVDQQQQHQHQQQQEKECHESHGVQLPSFTHPASFAHDGDSASQTILYSAPAPQLQAQVAAPTSSFSSGTNNHTIDSPLATLEMAAFLDSLDRVEIKPADGLTANMLPRRQGMPGQHTIPFSVPQTSASYVGMGSNGHGAEPFIVSELDSSKTSSLPSLSAFRGVAPPAEGFCTNQGQISILDESVSYAVPSDFSWWDLGLDANLLGAGASSSAPAEAQKLQVDIDATATTGTVWSDYASDAMVSQAGEGTWFASSTDQQQEPTSSCCSNKQSKVEHQSISSLAVLPAQGSKASCCTKVVKSASLESEGPDSRAFALSHIDDDEGAPVSMIRPGPCPRTGAPSCCCDVRKRRRRQRRQMSTTGNNSSSQDVDNDDDDLEVSLIDHVTAQKPQQERVHSGPRVHCVPNPSGTGCTCLCESSVSLLGVRRTLGHPSDSSEDDEGGSGKRPIPSLHLTLSASRAVSDSCACSASCPTCRGTADANVAVSSDGGAGSSSSSTLATSSSTSSSSSHAAFNASLLISLALQIYARAVRILRDGFSSSSSSSSVVSNELGDTSTGSASAGTDVGVGGLEIKIGGYRPSKENARRIALLAIRLELSDLEKGMGRVHQMAVGDDPIQGVKEDRHVHERENVLALSSSSVPEPLEVQTASVHMNTKGQEQTGATAPIGGGNGGGTMVTAQAEGRSRRLLAPVDGLVICKLREQLREMISRVETLERL